MAEWDEGNRGHQMKDMGMEWFLFDGNAFGWVPRVCDGHPMATE